MSCKTTYHHISIPCVASMMKKKNKERIERKKKSPKWIESNFQGEKYFLGVDIKKYWKTGRKNMYFEKKHRLNFHFCFVKFTGFQSSVVGNLLLGLGEMYAVEETDRIQRSLFCSLLRLFNESWPCSFGEETAHIISIWPCGSGHSLCNALRSCNNGFWAVELLWWQSRKLEQNYCTSREFVSYSVGIH